jgi:hypothetical protein
VGKRFALGVQSFLHAGESAEEQLGNIREGYGVLPINALVGELFGDVSKEGVDFAGCGQVAGLVENLGGEGFWGGLGGLGLAEMMGAEPVMVGRKVHAATTAASV